MTKIGIIAFQQNIDNTYRGGYRKPKITDILWVQLVFSPYYLVLYIHWWLRWIWKFWIKREEYGDEEKLYIIRKFMKHGSTAWDVSQFLFNIVSAIFLAIDSADTETSSRIMAHDPRFFPSLSGARYL